MSFPAPGSPTGPPSSPGAPSPRSRRVVRTVHRRRPLRAGIVVAGCAVTMLVGGFLLNTLLSGAEVLGASGRARFGEPIEFEAEARTDVVVVVRGETNDSEIMDRAVGGLACTVTLADGTAVRLDGSSQAVAEQTDFGATAAIFDAVAGPTVVTCDGSSGLLVEHYAVAPYRRTAKIVVWVLIGAGIVAGLIASWLITIGLRGEPVFERVPIP